MGATGAGALRSIVGSPSPSWADASRPQQTVGPDARTAHAWDVPAAMLVGSGNVTTAPGGSGPGSVEPRPSCPYVFEPQHCVSFAETSAQVNESPAAMAVAFVRARVGTAILSIATAAACRLAFLPQQ